MNLSLKLTYLNFIFSSGKLETKVKVTVFLVITNPDSYRFSTRNLTHVTKELTNLRFEKDKTENHTFQNTLFECRVDDYVFLQNFGAGDYWIEGKTWLRGVKS